MINVILNGACGRLGTTFQKVAKETTDVNIVAGVDVNRTGISTGFPLYKNIKNVAVPADASFHALQSDGKLFGHHAKRMGGRTGFFLIRHVSCAVCQSR